MHLCRHGRATRVPIRATRAGGAAAGQRYSADTVVGVYPAARSPAIIAGSASRVVQPPRCIRTIAPGGPPGDDLRRRLGRPSGLRPRPCASRSCPWTTGSCTGSPPSPRPAAAPRPGAVRRPPVRRRVAAGERRDDRVRVLQLRRDERVRRSRRRAGGAAAAVAQVAVVDGVVAHLEQLRVRADLRQDRRTGVGRRRRARREDRRADALQLQVADDREGGRDAAAHVEREGHLAGRGGARTRTTTGAVPAGGEPALQVIRTGLPTDPGTHQPAHVPPEIRTWRRPRTTEVRSTCTTVAAGVRQPRASVIRPLASNR